MNAKKSTASGGVWNAVKRGLAASWRGLLTLVLWLWRVLMLLLVPLAWLARMLLGRLSWQAPAWLRWSIARLGRLASWLVLKPWRLPVTLLSLVLAGGLSWWGMHWYQHRPKPVLTQVEVHMPEASVYDELGHPMVFPLQLHFDEPAARVDMVGKTLSSGITLKPAIEGVWRWESDTMLSFQPKGDWPVEENFAVSLDKSLLAPGVKLKRYDWTFHSAAFTVTIDQARFYQDPVDPNIKQLQADVSFSHPVDENDFKQRVSFKLDGGLSFLGLGNEPQAVVSFDSLRLHASVRSASLSVPTEDTPMLLKLDKGIRAQAGGKPTAQAQELSLTVPGRYSLAFEPARMTLVDNDRFEPEQVLMLRANQRLSEAQLQGQVRAWLLPEQVPGKTKLPAPRPDDAASDNGQEGGAATPRLHLWSAPEVTRQVLAKAQVLTLSPIPSEDEYSQEHGFKFRAPVGRSVYVEVAAAVRAFGGYQSRRPSASLMPVKPYPLTVKLLSQGSLLALNGERKVGFLSRGVRGVTVEIGRVLPNQLHHLIDLNSGGFVRPNLDQTFADTLVERFVEERAVPANDSGKPVYDHIDFGKYLREKNGGGLFLISLMADQQSRNQANASAAAGHEGDGEATDTGDEGDEGDWGDDSSQDGGALKHTSQREAGLKNVFEDKRLVLVTDIGIIAKHAKDGSQDVFVQSIRSGEPLSGARVEVLGRNGLPVFSTLTDATGHARLDDLSGLQRERQVLLILVSQGNDLSILPLQGAGDSHHLMLSRFDVGGVEGASNTRELSSYVFSDRGIYRPGEEAHLGIVTRTARWGAPLDGVPVSVEITDPRGLPVHRQLLRLSGAGFDEVSFKTEESSPSGDYDVNVFLMKQGKRDASIGNTSFKVREFEPDRMKVTTTLAERPVTGWIKPEEVSARVKAMHLFGAPANSRRVEAELVLGPSVAGFAKYKDYDFQTPGSLKEPFREALSGYSTDSNGEAKLNLNLQRFANATYRLYLGARVLEAEGGRGVSADAALLVSSAPYLVGVNSDANTSYLSRGTLAHARWIAVSSDLKLQQADKLERVWIERKFVSVLMRQPDGTYRYESRKKEIVREQTPFAIAAAGTEVALPTSEPGDFALALRDATGNELNRIEYSVAGQANLSRSLERNAELKLTLDKDSYTPGSTIEISIRAPYVGSGLITIERDRVYQHTWFKTTTTSSVQRITLPKDLEGNAYVFVQFVRDPGSDEIFTSPLSYGVVPFSIDLDARKLPVNLSLPETVRPGQNVDIKVSAGSGGETARVAVFAVDEGILQVARYTRPEPLQYFFRKRALQVSTSQILDLILPEFRQLMLAAAPGGDGDATLGRHLNPFRKKHRAPVAWWSGLMDVGAAGKTLHYTVPESFNGKLRVFAVAVTPSRVGVFDGAMEVRGDWILSSNLPTMVTPGDEFVVSVGVFNNLAGKTTSTTDKAATSTNNAANNTANPSSVEISLKTDAGLRVVGADKLTLNVPAQQEASAEFRLKATDTLGAVNVSFLASGGGRQGRDSDAVSVRPASVLQTTLRAARQDDPSQNVSLARDLYPQRRSVNASMGWTPLVWLQGLRAYLGNYSYSCTEQLISKALPALLLAQDPGERSQAFAQALRTLMERQEENGSFGLWAANREGSDAVSVYAAHYLVEAKERNFRVPTEMLEQTNEWLRQLAGKGSEGLAGARSRAYAIYLLTRQGNVTTDFVATLQQELNARYAKQWPADLTAAYLAASLKLMKQDQLADKLLANVPWYGQAQGRDAVVFDAYHDELSHDGMLLYLTARHFPQRLAKLPPKVLDNFAKALNEDRYHTHSAATLLLGLDAMQSASSGNGKLELQELNQAGKAMPLALQPSLGGQSATLSEAAKGVRFAKTGEAAAYTLLTEEGFDRKPAPPLSQGLEISRDLLSLDGKAISKVKVGEEFLVKLTFRASQRDRVSDVAVVDLLAGGLEPVLASSAVSYEDSSEGEGNQAAWRNPLGEAVPGSSPNWAADFAEVRADRVILYGMLERKAASFTYRVRATNAGTFTVPAPTAEGMYDRQLLARGKATVLEIVKP